MLSIYENSRDNVHISLDRGRSGNGCRRGETTLYPSLGLLSLRRGDVFSFLWHIRRILRLFGRMADGHAYVKLAKCQQGRTKLRSIHDFTRVSKAPFELAIKSSSNCIVPGSKRIKIVLPPNLKYPNSSAR